MEQLTISPRVRRIVQAEWKQFDRVQNIGGRADCQNSPDTFFVMRASQLMAWTEEMQESYLHDLAAAEQAGRNLLSEKYAYMMARTSPDEFARIQDQIPARLAEKDALIDEICAQHVVWQETLAERYPKVAGRGRPIRRTADSRYVTSFETYLWGELATYSTDTVRLYADYVEKLTRQGENMCEMILQNTVRLLGYASIAEAEEKA